MEKIIKITILTFIVFSFSINFETATSEILTDKDPVKTIKTVNDKPIPICTRPHAITTNPITNLTYLTCQTSKNGFPLLGAVYVFNGTEKRIYDIIDVEETPLDIAVNPITNKVYVVNFGSDNVTVIDGITNRVLSTIDILYRPTRIAVDESANLIYVTARASLHVINGTTDEIQDSIELKADGTIDLVVNPPANRAYVGHEYQEKISLVDTTTKQKIGEFAVWDRTFRMAVNQDTNLLYVAKNKNILVLDGSTLETIDKIPIYQIRDIVINPITNKLYVSNGDSKSVTVIDGQTNKIDSIIDIGFYTESLAVNPETNIIYVLHNRSLTKAIIDGKTDNLFKKSPTKENSSLQTDNDRSPLDQYLTGTKWSETQCVGDLVVVRNQRLEPACVNFDTAFDLFKRGWVKNMDSKLWKTKSFDSAKEYFQKNLSEKFPNALEPTFSINPTIGLAQYSIDILTNLLFENGTNYNLIISVERIDKISKVRDLSGKEIVVTES